MYNTRICLLLYWEEYKKRPIFWSSSVQCPGISGLSTQWLNKILKNSTLPSWQWWPTNHLLQAYAIHLIHCMLMNVCLKSGMAHKLSDKGMHGLASLTCWLSSCKFNFVLFRFTVMKSFHDSVKEVNDVAGQHELLAEQFQQSIVKVWIRESSAVGYWTWI